jgi:hypothetical protein
MKIIQTIGNFLSALVTAAKGPAFPGYVLAMTGYLFQMPTALLLGSGVIIYFAIDEMAYEKSIKEIEKRFK